LSINSFSKSQESGIYSVADRNGRLIFKFYVYDLNNILLSFLSRDSLRPYLPNSNWIFDEIIGFRILKTRVGIALPLK